MAGKLERRECGVKHAGICVGPWEQHTPEQITAKPIVSDDGRLLGYMQPAMRRPERKEA